MRYISYLLAMCIILLSFTSCADLQKLASIQKPTAKVEKVRFTGISFDDINLELDVAIKNPNALAVSLAGFDYDLQIAGASFLSGDQEKALRIEGNGASSVQIPLAVNYKDLFNTFNALKNQDSTQYKIAAGFKFDIPVLGAVRIPVSHTAYLPVIKIPKLKIGSLKLKKMGFTGADLELNLAIDNPNAIGFVVDKMNYNFAINGQNWAAGNLTKALKVYKKKTSSVTIPISLQFTQMGSTIIDLLKGDKSLTYGLTGDMGLGTTLPAFKSVTVPLNKSGELKITR